MRLYHFPQRTYSPRLGRWLQRDPLGYVDGVNLYEYARSMPTFFVDPFGLAASAGSWEDNEGRRGIIVIDDGDDPNDDEEGPYNGGYPAWEFLRGLLRILMEETLRDRGLDEEMIDDIVDFFLRLFWQFFGENLESWQRAFDEWLAAWQANRAKQHDDAAMGGHTPGPHEKERGPAKRRNQKKQDKLRDRNKQKQDEYDRKKREWDQLPDEVKKLRPELNPDWNPDYGSRLVWNPPPNVNESPWYCIDPGI